MHLRIASLTRSFVPAVALVLILGACTASTGSSAPADGADAAVATTDSDFGEILTDADGMVVYYFANDTEGVSNCSGECLVNWPVVVVDAEPTASDGVTAELGTIEAADGSTQLTVNGFPAYYFIGDEAAGDTNGQAVSGVWWVFGTDGEPIES